MFLRQLWKPVLHRMVTGQWERFLMQPRPVPFPGQMHNPGLYLHVPFCKELCPYCPYNKIKFDETLYRSFITAIHQEIDQYAAHVPGQSYTSLYIGGGTPTIVPEGLVNMVGHIRRNFNITGDICVELHPAAMDDTCLDTLKRSGVTMVSIGVESTDDHILEIIGRRHDGPTAVDAVRRAVAAGFDAVNVDLMFALPGQGLEHLDRDLNRVLDAGADQISTYPMFGFPYTELGERLGLKGIRRPDDRLTRRMFDLITRRAKAAGMERCAVWSFIRKPRKKFSSITRHHYIGFGPSGASMTGDWFYVNTFSVPEYVKALPERRPVTLAMPLTRRHEMAYWLYWSTYEMEIDTAAFHRLFQVELDAIFGRLLWAPRLLGMVRRVDGRYEIKESAAYFIHKIQNEYSLNYINRLWGTCRADPWPQEVRL
ncbi:MAG: radical SAM protein [Planctomycetota bacterium]